ncbi:MAG: restriction endonuclease [Bacteroidetes bacterium]|nr:restriction endonuclease [Bacteroidota bacterium]
MSNKKIEVGKAEAHYNANFSRILKYSVEMYHNGLNEHKIMSAPELDMLQNKVNLQVEKWNEKWDKIESKRIQNEEKEANIEEATERTEEAQRSLKIIDDLLIHTLNIDDTIEWNRLKSRKKFTEQNPKELLQLKINDIKKPIKNEIIELPPKPDSSSPVFTPQLTFLDKIFSSNRTKKEKLAKEKYVNAFRIWEKDCNRINDDNSKYALEYESELNEYIKKIEAIKLENEKDVAEWEKRKELFFNKQAEFNAKIDEMKNRYFELDQSSILEYCEMVLNNSEYPDSFPKSFELEYNPENKILIVEYNLPPIESFPRIKEVKYVASKNELNEVYISDVQLNKMFDESMYKIALRTIHELFEADNAGALEAVSFNGWVTSINKATGKKEHNCILSIQTKKSEFIEIDLSNVDPKICFRNLKGVASSKLSTLTPIQPILQISKSDKRFVDGYNVTNDIDSSTNIAAMDWEDFEHLIRELFEKEFQSNGGEVKVTQASRDGGVDAIAFDPDPIRGGKIVIQAKRYTNTVGVSAVRDLYGTVVNEGATKGILVSTADYGPDAYEFSKGKPLTLLNGSNLLHLLEKHGHHAKIDLKEAKLIFKNKQG